MKIDVQGIRKRAGEALEDAGPAPWLVAYDVMGIQEYVSANSRPLCLRGASGLLKDFDKAQQTAGHIFAGGGRGLAVVSSEEAAARRVLELKSAFAELTVTGSLAAACVPLDRARPHASLRWLQLELDNDKEGLEPLSVSLPTGREDECEGCGAWRVASKRSIGGREESLCGRCCKTLDRGRVLARSEEEASKSINDYAVRGFVAVVSADGNNMGQLFESLDSLERVALVSEAVRTIFEESHEAARGNLEHDTLSPVAGGDDLRLVLAPTDLPTYLERLMQGLKARTEAAAGQLEGHLTEGQLEMLRGVGVGIGVAVGDSHYPVAQMLECAHELERSAKRRARRRKVGDRHEPGARFALDFAFLTTPDFEIDRPELDPTLESRRPGARPMRIDGDHWDEFLKQASALSQVRNAQRAVLSEEGQLSPAEFFNLLRYQVARSREWQEFYTACGRDWRDGEAVAKYCPDPGMLEFVRLLELGPSARRSA